MMWCIIGLVIGIAFAAFGAWAEHNEIDTLNAEYWRSI